MKLQNYLHLDYLPMPLLIAMTLTRFQHFGDTLNLPDASLAVFFFAGFYHRKWLFVALLAAAGLIDYLAIAKGTSSWCISPAYLFLIPTYAVLWMAGRHCLSLKATGYGFYLQAIGWLALATGLAFLISNASFYLLSGRYGELSWLDYAGRVAVYFVPYLGYALFYGIVGFALVESAKSLNLIKAQHQKLS